MKSLLPAILLIFLAASCERPAGAGSGDATDELAGEREALEASRRELDRARRELEAQREAMQAEREARQAELDQAGAEVDEDLGEESEAPGAAIEDETLADEDFTEESGDLGDPADEVTLESGAEPLPVADYNLFYDGLADQGAWYETSDYGYVFQPSVVVGDADWRPYLHGQWHYTDYGWYWDSQEPFGWATYHYGRWVRIVGRGWCWVPGFRWAPSWVCWREGGAGIGWAPLPPETCWLGDDEGDGYGHGVEADFGVPASWFIFMEARHLDQPVWRHCVPRGQNRRWWDRSRPCTRIAPHRGRIYCGGPRHEGRLPLRPLGFEMLDGLRDRGRGRAAGRRDFVDGRIRAFAPGVDVPWNPRLQPGRTAGWLGRVEVDRDGLGTNAARFERARDARREWIRRAANWREDIGVGRARMSDLLEANRRRVADGTTRRTTRSGFARVAVAEEARPEGRGGGRQTRTDRETVARTGPEDAVAGPSGPVDGMVRDRGRGGLPRGVRPDRSSGLDFLTNPAERDAAMADPREPGVDSAGPPAETAAGTGFLAGSGSAARRRAAANAVDVEAPTAIPQGRRATANARAAGNAADDARQRRQLEVQQRQEQVRQQQEQARQSQLERAQRQQEQLREQAARAEAQRLQQQAEARAREQARQEQIQQQAAARQQAAQRAREQQEQLHQARQEAMQRQEQARQQAAEQARQQAAERARQQQEQQARQQSQRREQAERIRQQQERLREAAGQRRR